MSEDKDDSQKTEEPTQHKLEEARKKGQIPQSREVNNFFITLSLAFMIAIAFPLAMEGSYHDLSVYLVSPEDIPISPATLRDRLHDTAWDIAGWMALPLLCIVALVIFPAFLQGRGIVTAERITPKWEKISPVAGIKRLFSVKSLMEFVKGLLKLTLISVVCYVAIHSDLPHIQMLPSLEVGEIIAFLSTLAFKMAVGMCCVMFLIAILDYAFQHQQFMKQMRMTKQEIKDEYKQQEGDPHIKGKLKQIRMEKAKQRMMQNVPDASVIITNPTHYAVALKYETGVMGAPRVVAKGVDAVAFRIREIAEEHEIPIVENPPLARALHKEVDLDEEIPYEHYKAVAEVISYVYRLKNKL